MDYLYLPRARNDQVPVPRDLYKGVGSFQVKDKR
jgi:hypothetical protein